MSIKQSFLLAIKSIMGSKVRSLLTMLGIIIGVAAVIVIVSVGNGMTASIQETFESMGTNLLTVNVFGRGSTRTVSVDDMYALVEESESLAAVSPSVSADVTLKIGSKSHSTAATGAGEDYDSIRNLTVEEGRFLQYIDIARRQKVCVVGTYIQDEFYSGSALGQSVKVNGEPYTIVGVLEEQSDSSEGSSDDCVIIPYTNAMKLTWNGTISSYSFSAADADSSSDAKTAIENRLYETFGSSDYYRVNSMAEMVETMSEMTGMIVTVLSVIAAISLLVGGIGIMNIMLVSVTERTREIGIRKSLGAKKKDIMSQFVIEAATTSSVGGVLGTLFGVALAYLAGNLLGMAAKPTLSAILIATLVSLAIGVLFGFLPANKAANLNPIDALRYD